MLTGHDGEADSAPPAPASGADAPSCLFFCRGRGRGHAVPDLEIAKALRDGAGSRIRLRFVSYSTGADVLEEAGEEVIRLGLPDLNPFVETLVLCARVIGMLQPDLVVSHEEFAALPAAGIFGVPAVFLTDWFVDDPDRPIMRSLQFADEILFLEREGWFEPPAYVKDRVRYLGPLVRPLQYARTDRKRARDELGLPADAVVIGVVPGAWATEARTPLWDLLLAAFDALSVPRKHLVWNAGDDADELATRAHGRSDVTVIRSCDPIERLMAACDLGVTKANRGSTLDLHHLGVPSLSLSFRSNPVDDRAVSQIASNRALDVDQLSPASLADELRSALERGKPEAPPTPPTSAADAAARRIARHLSRAATSQTA